MKIALIDRVYNEAWYTWYLCRELSSRRGSTIICYGPKGAEWSPLPGTAELKGLWSPLRYPFQIARAIRVDKPDIVHVQFEYNMFGRLSSILMFPILLAILRVAGVRVVVTLHSLYEKLTESSLPIPFQPRVMSPLSTAILLLIRAFSDGNIVHFNTQRTRLITKYRFDEDRTAVIPHGTEYTRFVVPRRLSNPAKPREILYFGNITPRKGIGDLIKSLGLLAAGGHEVRLTIAGKLRRDHIGYFEALKTLVAQNGLEGLVEFAGFIEPSEIPRLMGNADLVVFPHREVFSASGSLAHAKGVASRIVITDHSMLRSQLGTYPAVTVPSNDPEALAAAIIKSSDEIDVEPGPHPLAEEIRSDSWDVVAERTHDFYVRVMGK